MIQIITTFNYCLSAQQDYLLAGADFVSTNTFNSTSIAMADYQMENMVTFLFKITILDHSIHRDISKPFT